MPAFNWLLNYPAKLQRKPKLLEATFGDGYYQRAADGINNDLETWTLNATGVPFDVAEEIESFLEARGGWEYFAWKAPKANAPYKNYICKEWDISYNDEDDASVSFTFIEVPDPTTTTTTPAP